MKLAAAVLALTTALTLTACTKETAADAAAALQQSWQTHASTALTCDLTADYGDRVYPFTLTCTETPTAAEVTITEPSSVAGVTARVTDDGATLTYDGAEVFTGALTPEGLSPMEAVPLMFRLWREGLILEAAFEPVKDTPCLTVLYRVTDEVSLRTWFSLETSLPLMAELISGGYAVITASFTNVTTTPGG